MKLVRVVEIRKIIPIMPKQLMVLMSIGGLDEVRISRREDLLFLPLLSAELLTEERSSSSQ
jgi:hypothetical protein